jgi:hypothetical protein
VSPAQIEWYVRRLIASQADSLEQLQVVVAFGYSSVLLGNLCQNAAIRAQVRSELPGRNLKTLIKAVEMFVEMHRTVDIQAEEVDNGEGSPSSQNKVTDQLELIASSLRQMDR